MAPVHLGDYYFQYDCPHCAQVSPLIEDLNRRLVDAELTFVPSEPRWVDSRMHKQTEHWDKGQWFRATEEYPRPPDTPTIYWADGLQDDAYPFEGPQEALDTMWMREYLTRRVMRVYLRERIPEWDLDQDGLEDLIDRVLDSSWAVTPQPGGGREYDPFHAVHEMTARYA